MILPDIPSDVKSLQLSFENRLGASELSDIVIIKQQTTTTTTPVNFHAIISGISGAIGGFIIAIAIVFVLRKLKMKKKKKQIENIEKDNQKELTAIKIKRPDNENYYDLDEKDEGINEVKSKSDNNDDLQLYEKLRKDNQKESVYSKVKTESVSQKFWN